MLNMSGTTTAAAAAAITSQDSDANPRVRAQCAGAIMSLAITTEGKQAAMGAGVTDTLPPLLRDSSSSVVLAAIKAITTVADHPQARRRFSGLVDQLAALKASHKSGLDESAFERAIDKAIATITWKP
ncbi:hypothetical protein PTSG_05490 [Salpingoeca rosetta]|uniref:Condensin complex subunit 1 C-terminal domain-containing protein n=1 Tax=Salpingoeca rosetta (strain ATCC 50818 / BSB-021) TaxID=946362 RepID=F2UBD2_SALR5|nr:uncharacterized protein PTSG_05490 [Salpingoeca rosetta]EGD73798.1 hypothetical protein PTSG_05490 [Salpingoeca rosetta]|eukprot:XP_004993361.1 hypothetical protein PTSG_05490 [Salpingoeca rosetta]